MEKLRLDLVKESEAMPSEEDDEVYEEIEAPKFVDFSLPDCSRPDDRSWFCSRVGCDQNHEEVDPDALLRTFRTRVIEARSPNVCRRKAWDREAPSLIPKCPKSAPAKSFCRTAGRSTVTSVAENMAKTKLKDLPVSSLRLTPGEVKSRSQHSKRKEALTTPKIQKCPTNQEDFRSMSRQREPVSVVTNKSVAKSLFAETVAAATDTITNKEKAESSSPSKCETSVSDVCAKTKKVKVTKRVKNVPSRYLCIPKNQKSSKNAEDSSQNLNKADKTKSTMKLKSGASSIFCNPSNDLKADKEMDCHATAKVDKQFLVVNSDKECLNLETQSGEMDSIGQIKSRKMKNCEKDIQDKVSFPHSSSNPDSGSQKVEAMTKVDDEKENAPSSKKRVVSSNTRNFASENIMSATRKNDPQKEVRSHIKSTTETSDREKHKRTNIHKECLNLETQSGEMDSIGQIKSRKMKNCEKDIQDKVSFPHSSSNPDSGSQKVEAMTKVDDEKENAPSSKKRVVSSNTRNFASENIMSATRKNDPQKEVRSHIKSTTETSDREKHKRTITNPRPFRLRVDERRILKDANQERRLQVEAQAQKKSESHLKHAEVVKAVTTKEKTTTKMVEPSRQTSKDRSVTTLRKPLDAKLGRGNSKIENPFVTAKGTRPTTVPREPNFHTVHLPRGCSKRAESKS